MLQLFKRPNINFLGARIVCVALSTILILVGLVAVYQRGRGLLDIDFVGGVSVEAVFKQPQSISQIRAKLFEKNKGIKEAEKKLNDIAVQNVEIVGDQQDKHFIITSSTPQISGKEVSQETYLFTVRNILKDTFGDELEYGKLDYTIESSKPAADVEGYEEIAVSVQRYPQTNGEGLSSEVAAQIQKAAANKLIGGEFSAPTISKQGYSEEELTPQLMSEEWTLTFLAPKESLEKVLSAWKEETNITPNFPTSTTVGGSVARNTRIQGILAILASLAGMAIYISIRFHRWIYGLVAVIGLLHDVLVVLGLLALSKWCVSPALQIDEFRIGLPVVAAFLTIIAYSINDTIILFDRIRENLGKSTVLTGSMINMAINQTLSRTVLTSATTLLVALILYLFGGQGIHAFAFAIAAGIACGTYSTIGICSALLFWAIGVNDLKSKDETMPLEKM
jgi:SecD/SecF fusion protein